MNAIGSTKKDWNNGNNLTNYNKNKVKDLQSLNVECLRKLRQWTKFNVVIATVKERYLDLSLVVRRGVEIAIGINFL
jgi:hypothetical protein